jgi:hypothetical protein
VKALEAADAARRREEEKAAERAQQKAELEKAKQLRVKVRRPLRRSLCPRRPDTAGHLGHAARCPRLRAAAARWPAGAG